METEDSITKEELAEAVRILKEDLSKSEIRQLNKRLDDMETSRSERAAKDDERWEKLEKRYASEEGGEGKSGENPEEGGGDKGSGEPVIPPVAGGPPPVVEPEPVVEKKGRRAWWERELYSKSEG